MNKCPYLKELSYTYYNEESFLIDKVRESFQDCIGKECKAYNAHRKKCKLIDKDI